MKDGMKGCIRNGMEDIMKDGMRHCIAATVALLFLVASAATATELENDSSIHVKKDLQEVVVVGTKANRHNLSPAAVSVMDAHQLQTRQVVNLNDLSGLLPNFYMPEYGSRQTTPISIRGVMSKVKGTAVGFYVDGIPHFETSAFDANMLDLRAVEVFRGPQGTLYGRNTIGGVINLYTPTPFEYQGTKVRLGYGNYNHTLAQFSNYTRMGNSFGTHVSGYYQHNGGYFENTFLGRKADKMNLGGGKLGFYWNPAARWNLRLISSLDYTNQGGYPYAVYDAAKQEAGNVDYNREKTDHTDGRQTHLKDFTSSLNHTRLIPKIGVQYKFDNRNTAFANITQGYKAGAFNQTFQKDEERSYAPEYNWNYEVGVKTGTRNGKVSG